MIWQVRGSTGIRAVAALPAGIDLYRQCVGDRVTVRERGKGGERAVQSVMPVTKAGRTDAETSITLDRLHGVVSSFTDRAPSQRTKAVEAN